MSNVRHREAAAVFPSAFEPRPAMRRIHDATKYDELQHTVAVALVADIRMHLEGAGLRGETLRETVESLAFSIGALVDGSTHVEAPDDYLVPILGFARGRMRDKLLL